MKQRRSPEEKTANKGAVIRPCSCSNDYQDETYGAGNRVHNPTNKGYRCTVCSREKVAA